METNTSCTAPVNHFRGGVVLSHHKADSNIDLVLPVSLPPELVLPLGQHIGSPSRPLVKVGTKVLKGQKIAEAEGVLSVPIHAPTSGTITEIDDRPLPDPSGLSAPCLVLKPDGLDLWETLPPHLHCERAEPFEMIERIAQSGIVGLGGAVFPAHFKLRNHKLPIHTIILNGAECEPYITCDETLMHLEAEKIIKGAEMLMKILGAERAIIAIEDPMESVCSAFSRVFENLKSKVEVRKVPTIYPEGGEKQLIKVLTGQEVPAGGFPGDLGILCQNVATAYSIFQAIDHGRPLISRLVTVTGQGIAEPGNYEVLLGTPISHVVEEAGGYTDKASRLVMGGPMMGTALPDDSLPVVKATNCILVLDQDEIRDSKPAMPCIRCGECERHCPQQLLPQMLYWHSRAQDYNKAKDYNLFDCIECGCCTYVCPSHIPLVDYYRHAKTQVRVNESADKKANLAKQRHEAKEARLAAEKAARLARQKAKKAALKKDSDGAIKQAVDRAKGRKDESTDKKPEETQS